MFSGARILKHRKSFLHKHQPCLPIWSEIPQRLEYVDRQALNAPEAILGAPYEASADMWALGCVVRLRFLVVDGKDLRNVIDIRITHR